MLKDITPTPLMCCTKKCCPALFEDPSDPSSLVLIGSLEDAQKLGIAARVGQGEVVVRIPKGLIK